jgi:large subunit ribosomal protein L4
MVNGCGRHDPRKKVGTKQAMVSLPVYDRTGAEIDSYEIDPTELAPRINKQLLHDAVVMYQTNRRQGSAKTKSRAEVAYTTTKMYRQKGTGRARAGFRGTNIRRGGGRAFAKRPRDWSYRLPKKALRLATRMALAARIADREIVLIDHLSFDAPRTKEAASVLKALGIDGVRLLVAVEQYDINVYKSIRNLAEVTVLPVLELNALAIMRPRRVLMTKAALDAFRRRATDRKQRSSQEGD